MAVQVNPIAPSLPATTAIQDPAVRQFANAVADILRTSQTADGAVAQLERAAGALSKVSGSAAPPAISQWLYSSELYQRLSGAIERVDTSAQEAIVAEALARAQAITAAQGALQTQINSINAELATISQTPAYDAAETYAAGDLVTYEGGLYRALQETTGNAPTSATHWEKVGDYASLGEAVAAHALQLADHETRVTIAEGAITAEAEARTLLATQVGANTAAIQAEAQTRTTETGALSTQITTVVAQYQAADAAIEARFDVPDYDGEAVYAPGDPVLYDGAVYQALLLAQGVLPTDATYWTKLRDLTLNTKLLAEGVLAAAVRVEPHRTLMGEAFTSSFGTYMLGDINLSGGTRITSADALDLQRHFNGQVVRPYVDEFFLPTILANPTKYAVYFDQGLSEIAAERAARTAAVQTAVSTLADADGALAQQITTLSATVDDNAAAIQSEATARAQADSAEALAREALSSRVTSAEGAISSQAAQISDRYTKADTDAAIASASLSLTAAYQAADAVALSSANDYADATAGAALTSALASVSNEAAARADADGALAESITTVASATGVNAAAIVTEAETRTTNDLAIVSALDTLWSISGASKALSQDGKNLITNWQTATAQEWQTLQAEVLDAGGNTLYAAVAAESQARADFEGKVAASWMVKAEVDVGTGKPYVAGIALGAEGQGGAATSEFLVRADRFAMVMPGYGEYIPFAIGDFGPEFSGLTSWSNVTGASKPQDGATRNVFQGDWTTSTSYAVGDIVLKDGNGWSCILAHTSSSSNQPPASGSGNTWWTLYAAKGSDGAQGLHALTVLVPNSAHTLPAASDGVVASYVGSGTTIQVFEGTTALSAVPSITGNGQFTIGTPTQVPASTITVGSQSYSGTTATVAQHSAMVAGTDSVVVTYPITVQRTDGATVTLSATQTLTKSKAGVKGDAGVSAKAAFLTATSQVFQVAKNGTITPSSITLTATGQNVTGSPAFTVTSGTAALTGTGNARALASNDLTTDAATIKIAWDGQEDFVTIVKVREGADGSSGANAIVAVLSNESHTIPADSAGNNGVFTGANTTMTIYSGTSDDSANWTVTASASSVTGTLSGKTYTVTGLSADAGYVDLTASRSGYASIVKRFVLTKSKAGPAGSPGSTGAQGPAGPAVVVTANRALSFTATDGALDGSQADIVLTASVSGITTPTYTWTFSGLQTNPTASTTSSQTIAAAQFGTSKAATVTCTVNGSYVDQVTIVRLEKSTAEAGATVGANASNLKAGIGVNMVFNGDLTDGLAGVAHIYNSGGTAVTLGWNLAGYIVSGEGTGYIVKFGGPADGSVFDVRFQNGQNRLAVTPGARYEVYAWLNTHRCEAAVNVHWYDANGGYISEVQAPYVYKHSGIQSTADMVQSFQFVTAPANARQADVRIRARTLETNPYCFFSRVFFGAAGTGQTEPSPWSPGRGISQITPSNVTTYIENAAIGAAQIGSINLVGTSNFAVKTATSGARMDMDSRRIKVYDANDVLRVQLGDLTV